MTAKNYAPIYLCASLVFLAAEYQARSTSGSWALGSIALLAGVSLMLASVSGLRLVWLLWDL